VIKLNESRANVLKAIAIAKKMGGNMSGAVKKIEKLQKGLSKQIEVQDALRTANESDLPTTTKKGKTVKAVHTKSGKEIVVVDTPASRKKLKRMGFKVESINERSDSRAKKTLMRALKNSKVADVWSYDNDQIVIEMTSPSKENFIVGNIQSYDPNESVNEAKGNVVVIDRKYIPKIAHVRKVLKLKMGKDLSVYKTDGKNVYHKVSDSQIKRFLDRLDRFDVKYKLGESVNESRANVLKAIKIAKSMGGNMSGAVKKIEKIQKGLSKQVEVEDALRTANESVNEAVEPSGIMAKINKIVQSKQAAKIDGVLMDMFSAGIMMKIFNAVNDKSKKDMNKGTMRQVKVILHKVMKQNKVRESVNENKKDQVYWQLVKNGDRPSEAKKVLDKYYDKVNKMYRNASVQKKAEIISALSARNEGSCGYGIDGKVGKEPAGPHLLKKKKKKVDESVNEAPEHDLARELNKASDVILKLIKIYGKKADVDGMTRSWMMGLHAKLKKAGIKI